MRISMPRGDIKLVRFVINDSSGAVAEAEFTEIYFTVKKTTREVNYEFQKRLSTGGIIKVTTGEYQVKIEPEDTGNMSYGNYKFDIQIVLDDKLKETFLGDFILTEEVTFNENE